jgi:glutathione S-transferase
MSPFLTGPGRATGWLQRWRRPRREPPTLVALPLSPWSEKARWVLDHHDVPYVEKPYLPVVGSPLLRWRLRRQRRNMTPPFLVDGSGTVCVDTFDIARYAERTGHGEPLLRRGDEQELARWHQLSEQAMQAARALATIRMAQDDAARDEAVATVVPRGLARLFRPAARVAVRFLQRKYRARDADEERHRESLRGVLLELRRALADGRRYLTGDALSYCDIAMAAALMGVEPADAPNLPPGSATRRTHTDLELAGEFTDLLGWRDQVHAAHRKATRG